MDDRSGTKQLETTLGKVKQWENSLRKNECQPFQGEFSLGYRTNIQTMLNIVLLVLDRILCCHCHSQETSRMQGQEGNHPISELGTEINTFEKTPTSRL